MRPSKKFVLIGKQYLPAQGGIENIMLQTARFLRRFGRVIIITISADNRHGLSWWQMYPAAPSVRPYQDCDGNQVYPLAPSLLQRILLLPIALFTFKKLANYKNGKLRVWMYWFFYWAYFSRLKAFCRDAAFVQSFEGNFWGRLGHDAAHALRIPFVIAPFMHQGSWGDDCLNVRLYCQADALLTLSEYEKAWYRGINIPEHKLVTMSNYPLERPTMMLRSQYGIQGPIVLFMGRKETYKGYALLLDAWDIVHRQQPLAWCVLLGPGFAPHKDTGRHIICDGATEKMPSDYTVFCMPSESETFGLVYIEAWSLSKPVVARPIPAVVELMHGQAAGVLISRSDAQEVADTLLMLLENEDVCAVMGRTGNVLQKTYYNRLKFEENLEQAYKGAGCVLGREF
jgi:glycosyltransferase involved in cell wall biosynthesis